MTKITLKDIGSKCNVSPTVVSAILNNRQGRITCSSQKRQEILDVAKSLNYQPNLFARSMVEKKSPFIGIMLNLAQESFADGLNLYFQKTLPHLTFRLNFHNYEVVFLPYQSEEEQIARLKKLYGSGLCGGIISNIIPESHEKFIKIIKNLEIPHILLGRPLVKNCYATYMIDEQSLNAVFKYANSKNITTINRIIYENDKLKISKLTLPAKYSLDYQDEDLINGTILDDDALYLFVGYSVYTRFQQNKFSCSNALIIDNESNEYLIPHNIPALLMPYKVNTELINYATDSVVMWMKKKIKPIENTKIFQNKYDNFKWINAEVKNV